MNMRRVVFGVWMERRFLLDVMLGSLAKWLRALGYDALFRNRYREEELEGALSDGRVLLSRNRKIIERYSGSIRIYSEKIAEQLREMRDAGLIHSERNRWFTRCLICNVPLEKPDLPDSRENVPEHVFYQKTGAISRCPSCGRYFWPGTHRERMIRQLREWSL